MSGHGCPSLVIAPQWIGDAVMTEPLLRQLYSRGERLTVGALPWVASVYHAMPHVADIIEFPFAHGGLHLRERRRLATQMHGQFEIAYICPNSFKSALLPFFAGIPKRVGYWGEMRWGLLTHRLKNPSSRQQLPMVAFYAALCGDDVRHDPPQLQLASTDVRATLDQFGLSYGNYYVLAPGSEYGEAKRWPIHHFAALASQLDAPVVLLGSGKEAGLCSDIARICSKNKHQQVNLAGKTSLMQAMCVVSACKATISNDSGLMHIAAGFGVPQVAIFGSSSPQHTPPLNAHAHVLWLKNDATYQPPLDCTPCFQRICPLGHTRCLNDISAASVLRLL
jgi:heptosyltransferase II